VSDDLHLSTYER